MSNGLTPEMLTQLSQPFSANQVSLKVQTNPKETDANGFGQALIVAYIDARDVITRLNAVAGGDWSDSYQTVNGGLECALTVCGVTRHDIGSNDNDNEQEKSAYSDALKRAAVKFGIGLHIYNLPKVYAQVKKYGNYYYLTKDGEREARNRMFGSVASSDNQKKEPEQIHEQQKPTVKQNGNAERKSWAASSALITRISEHIGYYGKVRPHIINALQKLGTDGKIKLEMTDDEVFAIVNQHAKAEADQKAK